MCKRLHSSWINLNYTFSQHRRWDIHGRNSICKLLEFGPNSRNLTKDPFEKRKLLRKALAFNYFKVCFSALVKTTSFLVLVKARNDLKPAISLAILLKKSCTVIVFISILPFVYFWLTLVPKLNILQVEWNWTQECSTKYWTRLIFICDVLRDLVPTVQFKEREKHPWRSVTFSKVAGFFKRITFYKHF